MKLSRKNQRPILALFGAVMLVLSFLLIPLEKKTSAHGQTDEVQHATLPTERESVRY